MKTYVGRPIRRSGDPVGGNPYGFEVTVYDGDRTKDLPHYVRHSPDGFAWGYGGSGPSELARCLLIDVYGSVDAPEVSMYQTFKFKVIAMWPMKEGWKITEQEIRDIVATL